MCPTIVKRFRVWLLRILALFHAGLVGVLPKLVRRLALLCDDAVLDPMLEGLFRIAAFPTVLRSVNARFRL